MNKAIVISFSNRWHRAKPWLSTLRRTVDLRLQERAVPGLLERRHRATTESAPWEPRGGLLAEKAEPPIIGYQDVLFTF